MGWGVQGWEEEERRELGKEGKGGGEETISKRPAMNSSLQLKATHCLSVKWHTLFLTTASILRYRPHDGQAPLLFSEITTQCQRHFPIVTTELSQSHPGLQLKTETQYYTALQYKSTPLSQGFLSP